MAFSFPLRSFYFTDEKWAIFVAKIDILIWTAAILEQINFSGLWTIKDKIIQYTD